MSWIQHLEHDSQLLPTAPTVLLALLFLFLWLCSHHAQEALVHVGSGALAQVGQLGECGGDIFDISPYSSACITHFLGVPIPAPFPACTHPGDGILADPMEAELAEVEGRGVGLGAPLHDEVGDLWKWGVRRVGKGMAPGCPTPV